MNSGNTFNETFEQTHRALFGKDTKCLLEMKKVKTFKQTSGALNHKRGKTGQEKKKEKPSEFENLIETRNSG